ncbi:flippase [Flavobacterium gilvum]|uniref:Polysaccharide biosynthesis protein C-terminal domain-containing protein n=1 Tax=Flavobacterium gilvum TaxID=1492737 RepID=A0AAC9I6K1_9FLAO|nr:flippase [Flavobacterium gilvum]AOW11045.1 hypothetical protein EM308_16990 [Flavobacterium gilvum]KFC57990.1 hypothetical protein FEM08_32290 [Flavobacterium gilvum]
MVSTFSNNRLVKNVLSLGIVQVANYVLPLLAIPIVSRIIGPEKFGIINFVSAFVAYFTLIIGYGFNLTATRKLAQNPTDSQMRNRVFSEVFYAQIILLVFSSIIFLICLFFVPALRNEWEVSIFTFIVCISTLLTQDWLFQAMQDLPKVAILNFVSKFIFIILIILIINHQSDYIWYAFSLSISQILVSIISFIWSINRYKLKLYKINISSSIALLLEERTYFFSLVVINLYTSTNIVLLGFLTSSAQVGFYTAAQKITIIIQAILILPLRQALFPFMANKIKENVDNGIETAQKLLPIIFWPALCICIGTLFLSKYIIQILYGSAFEPAIIILQILSFIPMIIALSNIWGLTVMMNLKLDKIYFRITSISAFNSIILNLILIHYFDVIGSAIAWLLTELITLSSIFFYLNKIKIQLVGLKYFNPRYLKGLLLTYYNK